MTYNTCKFAVLPALVLLACLFIGSLTATSIAAQASPEKVSAKLELEIGRAPENDDFFLNRVVGIAVDASGRIFVLDNGENDVKVFDRRGRFLNSFGREGTGPGEFTRPIALRLTNDSLVVTDGLQRRISIFALDGTHLKTERLPSLENDRPMYMAVSLRGGALASISSPQLSDTKENHDPYTQIVVRRSGVRTADTLASIRSDGVFFTVPGPRRSMGAFSPGFGDGGAWALSGDTLIAVADGYSGAVRWFVFDSTGHHLMASATVAGTTRRASARDLEEASRRHRETASNPADRREKRIFSDPPAYWSRITRAVFADDGNLWIAGATTGGASSAWTVLAPNGRRVFGIPLPRSFVLEAVHRGRLYGRSTSAEGTPVIQVYSLVNAVTRSSPRMPR
ncbi:MAG: 6-bladed beta-propeller [Gemmatimonadaceae bacterium]|nr:6-bladed beta-propeller [Gemmatimonadaceae bacterium]